MKNRVRPKTKRRYRDSMRNVIKGLSRKVLVYKQPIKQECPNCYYDKMTGRSSGKCKWTAVQAQAKQAEWENSLGTTNPPGNPTGPAITCDSARPTLRYKYFVKGRCPVCLGKGYLTTIRKRWVDCLVTWDPRQRGFGNQLIYTPAGTEGSTIVQLKTHPKYYDLFKNAEKIFVDGIECKISRAPILRGLGNQAVLLITAFTTEKIKVDEEEIIKDY